VTRTISRDAAADLSLRLIRMTKLLHALRQHAPRVHPAVEPSAYPMLFNLMGEPQRVSVLADCIHSDVSTVSRQVSTLVQHGLLEKVTDPSDGRAQVVTLSDEGHALLRELQAQRVAWFQDLLADWTTEEAEQFAAHVARFTETLGNARERLGRGTAATDRPPAGTDRPPAGTDPAPAGTDPARSTTASATSPATPGSN
jgi:DNA-binding MarR family transcriptional regulator